MSRIDLEKLGLLALAWIATRPHAGKPSALRRALIGTVGESQGGPEWPALSEQLVAYLHSSGWLESGVALRASPRGRAALARGLGLEALPARATWPQLRARLAARAAGAAGPSADELRAAILKEGLGLRLSAAPRMGAVRNAIAWKALGRDDDAPFRRADVVRRSVERNLGGSRAVSESVALSQLAAKLAGARRASTDELRRATLGTWLMGGSAPKPEMALEAFAEHVVRLARQSETGRYGDHLVFISHVFRKACAEGAAPTEAGFRRQLAAAHQAGLLKLSRADLVEAMDPADVAASELALQGATFHFIRI